MSANTDAGLPPERLGVGSVPTSRQPAHSRATSWGVLLLCLPAVLSTAVLLAGVLAEPLQDHSQFDPFRQREATIGDWVQEHVIWPIVFPCFLGAAYGPLLIPIAGLVAIRATRGVRTWSRAAVGVWAPVFLALLSAGLFWGWLIHLELLP